MTHPAKANPESSAGQPRPGWTDLAPGLKWAVASWLMFPLAMLAEALIRQFVGRGFNATSADFSLAAVSLVAWLAFAVIGLVSLRKNRGRWYWRVLAAFLCLASIGYYGRGVWGMFL